MAEIKDINKYWTEYGQKHLKGKIVSDVRYLTPQEAEDMGWSSRPIAIFFSDGSYIYPSRDDEGNDGGALFGTAADGEDLLFPVLLK
jgi:hypothetical protein